MAKPSHIFIVGSFRTGTTLLRYMLDSSAEVGICNETRFVSGGFFRRGSRYRLTKVGDLSTETGAKKIIDFIYADKMPKAFRQVMRNVSKEEFLQALLESDRTDRALFDLTMRFYANGKPILGEKTPAHIYQVPLLMEWFPNAKIIHTLRDPRAIFVSQRRKMLTLENVDKHYRILRKSEMALGIAVFLQVLLNWLRVVRLHRRYQKRYPDSYHFVRFEDLVSDPEPTLKQVCDFLEIDFSEDMLNQPVVGSSFVPRKTETQGVDTSTIDRWRNHLHPVIDKSFVFWCKKYLLDFGYQ